MKNRLRSFFFFSSLAALATHVILVIGGLAQRDVGACADLGLGAIAAVEGLAGDDSVDFCCTQINRLVSCGHPIGFAVVRFNHVGCRTSQDVLEGKLDVARIEGGGLDEGQVVLACR